MPIGMKVRLIGRPGAIGSGFLENVSLSGAFVQTDLRVPPLAHIELEVRFDSHNVDEVERISACVIRRESRGIGLEWCEFAPDVICNLLTGKNAQMMPVPSEALAWPGRVQSI